MAQAEGKKVDVMDLLDQSCELARGTNDEWTGVSSFVEAPARTRLRRMQTSQRARAAATDLKG